MKKITKSLFGAFALIGVGIFTLTGATYAWFQNGNTGSVDAFDANVVKADGVLMSWDAEHWASNIAVGDDNYTGNENTDLSKLVYSPVSTTSTVTSGALTFFTAELDKTGAKIKTSAYDESSETASYVKFDIYFNAASAMTLNLDENTTVNFVTDKNNSKEYSAALASRIAFINHGTVAAGNADAVSNVKALNAGTEVVIYEPNYSEHTSAGEADITEELRENGAVSYKGIKGVTTEFVDRKTDTTVLADVTTVTDFTDVSLTLGVGYTKVTVYVWIEGQDVDCTNDVAETNVQVSLGFVKVTEPVENQD